MHTRISEELDDALQDAARRLRVPVSNLVRNVLEDVFDAVEAVTENVGGFVEDVVEEATDLGRRWEGRFRRHSDAARSARFAREARGEGYERRVRPERGEPAAPPTPPEPPAPPEPAARVSPEIQVEFPDVAAWQPLVLNAAHDCAACGRSMRRGDAAYLAVGGTGPGPTFLCEPCLDAMN